MRIRGTEHRCRWTAFISCHHSCKAKPPRARTLAGTTLQIVQPGVHMGEVRSTSRKCPTSTILRCKSKKQQTPEEMRRSTAEREPSTCPIRSRCAFSKSAVDALVFMVSPSLLRFCNVTGMVVSWGLIVLGACSKRVWWTSIARSLHLVPFVSASSLQFAGFIVTVRFQLLGLAVDACFLLNVFACTNFCCNAPCPSHRPLLFVRRVHFLQCMWSEWHRRLACCFRSCLGVEVSTNNWMCMCFPASVGVWYTCCTRMSSSPVRRKLTLWIRTDVPCHALLFPVSAQVCPFVVIRSSSLCLQVSSTVTESQCLSKKRSALNELVEPVVARQRACVVLDHRDCDCVVIPVCVGWLWFYDFALLVWSYCFVVFAFSVLGRLS